MEPLHRTRRLPTANDCRDVDCRAVGHAVPHDPPDNLTPTVPPTPAGSIESYWADATDAYVNLDWQSALDYLTLVQRIDDNYERVTVQQMLTDIYTALAAQNLSAGTVDRASEWLDQVVTLRPDDGRLGAVAEAVRNFAQPELTNTVMARFTLSNSLLGFRPGSPGRR